MDWDPGALTAVDAGVLGVGPVVALVGVVPAEVVEASNQAFHLVMFHQLHA